MAVDQVGEVLWNRGGPGASTRCVILGGGVYPVVATARHVHPVPGFNRLFLFERGSAEVVVGRESFRLRPGPAWLLPVGQSFRVTYAGGSRFHFFHWRWLDLLGEDQFSGAVGVPALELGAAGAGLIGAHGRDGEAPGRHWHPLLFAVLASQVPERPPRPRPDRQAELIAVVQRAPLHGISVAGLARRLRTTPNALAKRFRRDTGVPLKRWLVTTVMDRAKELLGGGDEPVQEIAERLGFPDPFYFQRAFKRVTGSTPSGFRRAVRHAASFE